MAAYTKRKCSVCGEEHTFCLTTGGLLDVNVAYEFVCPKSRRKGTITLTDLKLLPADRRIPPNSVIIKEVES
jgi:hypothetical protein